MDRTKVRPAVWVILPTYCEAENISVLLTKLGECGLGLDILVVDDNSPDGTAAIVEEISRIDSSIHILKRGQKTSLGQAYLAGFDHALSRGAMVFVTMDSDLSHDPLSVTTLIDLLDDKACVVGSRYVPGGTIVNWPLRRRLLSSAANWFVRILFRMPVKDCTSGFRVYSSLAVENILAAKVHSHGYSFQVEALKIAVDSGLGVVESPIRFVERVNGVSKMGVREVIDGIRSLTALRLSSNHKTSKL